MADTGPKPDATSSDYNAMVDYWNKVCAILGGAKTMRAAGKAYLPQFPNETPEDYEFRRCNAKFTNVFEDIVETLAAKPFTEEVKLVDGTASDQITNLIEDIDGKGNHIHVFAQATFFNGIANAIDWILVDYTKDVPAQATIAQERALGARPYWVHVPAQRVLAVYSDVVGGTEILTHFRIQEDSVERVGYGETRRKRVRVFNREPIPGGYAPATWELFEEQQVANSVAKQWVSIGTGPVTIGVIPLVPFTTGRRSGSAWQLKPSMQAAADLQIELFEQESGLKVAKQNTAFPMLSGNGVAPTTGADGKAVPIKVGPKSVLYAPARETGAPGNWAFIEPNATSLAFLANDIKETIQQLRELGRQPLTAQTGNLTVVTTQFAAQKGNSAIQAWALNLKDALEKALNITRLWIKDDKEAKVIVDTDFDVGLNDTTGPTTLVTMRAAGDLTQRTLWHEMQRRGTLSPEFDADEEEKALLDEIPSEPTLADGPPLVPGAVKQPAPQKP